MPTFTDHIAELLRDPTKVARQARDQRVVGYVSAAPVELILAADALPVRLRALGDAPTPHADQYLEQSFLPEVRGVLEQWLTGALDALHAVILPRGDDSAQRLYYYVSELQRTQRCAGPKPILFDVAAIPREASSAYTLQSLHRVAQELDAVEAQLPKAIQRTAERAALLADMRRRNLAGSLCHNIARANEFDWRSSFDDALRSWLETAPLSHATRIALAGSTPPDDRLHRFIEAAGGTVVWEALEMAGGAEDIYSPPPPGDGMLTALAKRYAQLATPAQRMLQSSRWLADAANKHAAHGVILWLIEEDEALPWETPAQVHALNQARIPVLTLTRQDWRAQAPARQMIETFLQSLRSHA